MLVRAGREADYVEIGLDGHVCYNPLHNDLDPYAVAYAIATMLNNLFGKSKEPFWQQAYTDLLKFVVLLRRTLAGYTTLSEVYRYVLDNQLIDADIRALEALLKEPPEVIAVSQEEHRLHCAGRAWIHWCVEDDGRRAHPYDAELETFLAAQGCRSSCAAPRAGRGRTVGISSKPFAAGTTPAGAASIPAFAPRSPKASSSSCRCSTTTRPCTGRSVPRAVPTPARRGPGSSGPCRPSRILLESGHVLALNFPVAMNPGLARALGVMLKLDFQRAVLQRIPRDRAGAAPHVARHPLRLRRVPRLCHGRGNGPDRRRADVRPVPPGAADSAGGHAEHQLPAIGAARRRELADAAAVLPHENLPGHERRVHGARRGGTVWTSRPPEGALQPVRRRTERAHLAPDRAGDRCGANPQRQQELRAPPRAHLLAARLHRVAERPGDCRAVRRLQPAAAAVLLPEAALSGRPDQLLRPRRAGGLVSSLSRILPFLRPIEDLLQDPDVTEVMVNEGGRRVFIERDGVLVSVRPHARGAEPDRRHQEHRAGLW